MIDLSKPDPWMVLSGHRDFIGANLHVKAQMIGFGTSRPHYNRIDVNRHTLLLGETDMLRSAGNRHLIGANSHVQTEVIGLGSSRSCDDGVYVHRYALSISVRVVVVTIQYDGAGDTNC